MLPMNAGGNPSNFAPAFSEKLITNPSATNMKTKQLLKYQSLALVTGLAVFAALWAIPGAAHGQTLYVTNNAGATICKYDAVTGAGNPSFITTPSQPTGIAVKDGILYFNAEGGVPGITYGSDTWKYDANTGVNLGPQGHPWLQ